MHHLCFKRFHHPTRRTGGVGNYERKVAAVGVDDFVSQQRTGNESLSDGHKVAQLGTSYQSSVVDVSLKG